MEQLRVMLRRQGVFSLREVRDLYLEPGGSVSLRKYPKFSEVTPAMLDIQAEDEALNFLFVDEGKINEETLEYVGKSTEWLYDELQKMGYSAIKDILYTEWSETDGFFIKTYNEDKDDIKKGN